MRDREEFEKLPVIKNRIANFNLKYSGELNGYVGLKQYQSHVDFIDGCWFMFQQQQSQQAKTLEAGSNASCDGKMGFATHMDVSNSYKAMIESE